MCVCMNICMYELCMYARVSSQDHNQNLLNKASDIYISELKFSVSYYIRHSSLSPDTLIVISPVFASQTRWHYIYYLLYILTVCYRYNFLLFVKKISQFPFKVSRLLRPSPSIKKSANYPWNYCMLSDFVHSTSAKRPCILGFKAKYLGVDGGGTACIGQSAWPSSTYSYGTSALCDKNHSKKR